MRKFIKAESAANDYLYVFGSAWKKSEIAAVCKRKIGVGADGVIFINKSSGVYCLDIYNSDGSEADFCGNACLTCAKILQKKVGGRFRFSLKTRSQTVEARVNGERSEIVCLAPKRANLGDRERDFIAKLQTENDVTSAGAFNAGNLHLAIACSSLNKSFIEKIVSKILSSRAFENGINVEFFAPCEEEEENCVRAVVFERGSGYTSSCGSGALAIFAQYNSVVRATENLTVKYDGGDLLVRLSEQGDDYVCLSDSPRVCFEGVISDDFFDENAVEINYENRRGL